MSYFIVGTAGHIDHGKTTLVKALTGIDTDRLKEEKLRGITIETGYAFLKIPEKNLTIGFIDVPGHEKFIKNMVTGIYGIDVLMLIIAADESIMPQTVEHFEICKLLGIERGFIVVTKIDLVDNELLEVVKEEIQEFTKNTFLEKSPVFFVSAQSGEGIDKLKNYLISLAEKISTTKNISSVFRLPVDRVFILKGFGTVVTGTTISGKIKTGKDVIVYPQQITSKVRNIHVHNSPVEEAIAGQRTALNLQGVEKDDIERGSIVTEPGYFVLKNFIFCKLLYLESNKKPLQNRITVKFHINTDIIPAKVIILNDKIVNPGEEKFVIFNLSKPTITLNGDRFIIRSFDDKLTLGGGTVVYASENKIKIPLEILKKLASEDVFEKLEAYLYFQGIKITDKKNIIANFNISFDKIDKFLMNEKIKKIEDNEFIHSEHFINLKNKIISGVEKFHKNNPHVIGIIKEELKNRINPELDNKLFNFAIDELIKENKIEIEESYLKLKEFKIKLDNKKSEIIDKIYKEIKNGSLKPPVFKELVSLASIDEKELSQYLTILIKDGKIEKISPEIYFDKNLFEKIKNELLKFLKRNNEISIKEFKNIANTSRKYLIPLLEYFDKIKITVRTGDKRVLR